MENKTNITVTTIITAPLQKVWHAFTTPANIMQWNQASHDWHCPKATNELKNGGTFCYTMSANDGSFSFDFSGKFITVDKEKRLEILLDDNRTMQVLFAPSETGVLVTETFEAEKENPIDMQKMGWQMILDNFKKHVEEM